MANTIHILGCTYDTQFDPSDDTWTAIKVYRDGNPIVLGGPFATEEEADAFACAERDADLQANSQFGVGA